MEITTLLEYSDRSQLRAWLQENHSKEKECWVVMSRSKTPPAGVLPYIDVVEEALCLGSSEIKSGETYTVYTGGTISGSTENWNGWFNGGFGNGGFGPGWWN